MRFVCALVIACVATAALPVTAGAGDPADLKTYYGIFHRGQALIPGADTRWTPQGLAYWPEQDALVIGYYDGQHTKNSRLGIIDRASGRTEKIFELPSKAHVGGLGMSGKYLWVTGDGTVSRFPKTALSKAGGRIGPGRSYPVKTSSTMTVDGSDMWLAQFVKAGAARAYHYKINGQGVPVLTTESIPAPTLVQGLIVRDHKVVWSRSFGRDRRSSIETHPLTDPITGAGFKVVAPNMAEGLAVAQGELQVVYESGSATYGDANYRVKTVHHGNIATVMG